jgi:ATP-dependent protease ClpP protease subunit
MVMTHDLQWGHYTSLSELQTMADAGRKMEQRYHQMMARYADRPVKDIKQYLQGHGNWMTATEAIRKIGLADRILRTGL